MSEKTAKSAEELSVEQSKKEMENKRNEITKYYKDSITHLKVQLEYEELLSSIEKSRAERVQAQIFLANAMANEESAANLRIPKQNQSQERSEWDASSDKAPPVRTLKTVDS